MRRSCKEGRVRGTWHFQVLPEEKSPDGLISMKPSWDCVAGLQIEKVTGGVGDGWWYFPPKRWKVDRY